MAVESTLLHHGIAPVQVELGKVEIAENLSEDKKQALADDLSALGFELIDDPKSRLSEKVKNLIIDLVHNQNNELPVKLSEYIASKMNHEYTFLSHAFSKQTGTTIEQFYIVQKVERVKELLQYGELNLNEIAMLMNYASPSHLTRQFKNITGVTPSGFRNANMTRKPLDAH